MAKPKGKAPTPKTTTPQILVVVNPNETQLYIGPDSPAKLKKARRRIQETYRFTATAIAPLMSLKELNDYLDAEQKSAESL